MSEKKFRSIVLYKNYFSDFFAKQNQKVKNKILWTFRIIETQRQIPSIYFKHLAGTDGLYEIRSKLGNNVFRIFCFFDDNKLIVLANGFQKKDSKNPKVRNRKST